MGHRKGHHDTEKTGEKVAAHDKTIDCDMSAEDGLIASLTNLRNNLRAGKRLEERYTMRTVDLILEPHDYGPEEVKATRERLNASQAVFARLLGVSPKTVQSWEQGLAPPAMARRLLDVINEDTDRWIKILRGATKVSAGKEKEQSA
jgi:putative transcriptional regulator